MAPVRPISTPAAPAAAGGTYEVKKGDTLGAIARNNLPPGVTLNQMLSALYRANADAFIGNNINRLRSGRILNLPDRDSAAGVDSAEADRLVRGQMSDFANYRRTLGGVAAAAPAEAGAGRLPLGVGAAAPGARRARRA